MVLPVGAVCEATLDDAGDADDVIEVARTDDSHNVVSSSGRVTVDNGCLLSGVVIGVVVTGIKVDKGGCEGARLIAENTGSSQ